MAISKSPFHGCCGIQILYGLNNLTSAATTKTAKLAIAALKNVIIKGIRNPWDEITIPLPKPYNYAMQLVALNQIQHDYLHKLMLKIGFKLVDKGWNLNHKNMNYLYSLHLMEGKKEYDLK